MPSRNLILLGVGLLGICPPSAWADSPASLRQQLEALEARVAQLEGSLAAAQSALGTETALRSQADGILQTGVSGLQSSLASETGARMQGDAALQQALSGLADQLGDTMLPPGTQVVLNSLENAVTLTATLRRMHFEKKLPWMPGATSTGDPGELVFKATNPGLFPTALFVELALPAPGSTDASPAISQLQALTQPINPNGSEDQKRPPRVKFMMGAFGFEGVVGALVVKTGKIGPNGERLSAIAEVTIIAATSATFDH
jgi:hypothetical protein